MSIIDELRLGPVSMRLTVAASLLLAAFRLRAHHGMRIATSGRHG